MIEDLRVGDPDDPDQGAVYAACAVLGVRTDALPCVLHAAYRALRDDFCNRATYQAAYLTLCKARGLTPEALWTGRLDHETSTEMDGK